MKTILVIDDDELCRAPAAELLRRSDWNVIEASDGDTGIRLALEHRPEVILCDLVMPRGNGYHVLQTLRQDPAMVKTRIIVVTGRDYPTDRRSAMEAGADEYLVKPVSLQKLQTVLGCVLDPAGSGNGTSASGYGRSGGSGAVTRLKFWGVRGSIPTPGPGTVFFGGNTSCVEVRADNQIIILDAGSGIRPLGEALAAEFGEAPLRLNLLISHTHWDHIQGFPFFLPAYEAKNEVRILGMQGSHVGLAATLAGQMESPYFPIALKEMPGNLKIEALRDMSATIGSVRVRACQTNHADLTVGYRLDTEAGSIAYLPDNESFPATADGAPASECERRLREFVRGVDVLICDSQYDREEYKKHVGWGHGCLDDVVRFAIAGEVECLYLFHHDPAHDDRKISSMLMHARGLALKAKSAMRIEAAREGDQLVLTPRAQRRSAASAA